MRRAVAFLLALALLGAAGLVYAHGSVGDRSDEVEMRETVVGGDSAEAEGIRVRVPVYCGGHLFWDTELETGSDKEPETEFRFSPARQNGLGIRDHGYSGLYVNLMMNMGASGNFGTEFDFENGYYGGFDDDFYDAYGEILIDVASRTEAGQEHTERVELTDWIDYVPLQFDLDLPGYIYKYDNGEEYIETNRGSTEMLGVMLSEYFRIPLTGPCPLEVRVAKNTEGEIVELEVSGVYEYADKFGNPVDEPTDDGAVAVDTWAGLNVTGLSVVTEDACYFALEQFEGEKELGRVDFSALPGGRGIYRLPFEYEGADSEVTNVRLDEIETVLPVEDDEYIELLDTDGERLLMLTKGNGKMYLTQARLPGLTDVKKTELTDMVDLDEDWYDGYSRAAQADGLYYIETTGGRVLLLESVDGGDYELRLNVPANFEGSDRSIEGLLNDRGIRLSYDNYNSALLWDGERFATARWCGNDGAHYYGEASGFVLWVYDRTGLLYCGAYDSSLNCSPTEQYNNTIRSWGDLELSWT